MVDHEKCENFNVLYVFEDDIDELKSLVLVKEELELPLEDGCTLFEEVHDSTTLEPTYGESFEFLREVCVPTLMEPSHDEHFSLSNPLGELVISPTSYTSIFCSIHYNKVLVKGFFAGVT